MIDYVKTPVIKLMCTMSSNSLKGAITTYCEISGGRKGNGHENFDARGGCTNAGTVRIFH